MSQALGDQNKKLKFFALLIAFVTLSVYSFVLPASFKILDDQFSIVENEAIRSFSNLKSIFSSGFFGDHTFYRPLVALSFMTEFHWFGLNPTFYNLDNVLVHILNAVSVLFLIFTCTQNLFVSCGVSLLFAVHPIQWEAVCNISGRAILLSAFFSINAFTFFVQFSKFRKISSLVISLILFVLGLLCKESTAVLPALILFYSLIVLKIPRQNLAFWFSVGLYFFVFANYLLLRNALGITETFAWNNFTQGLLGVFTFLFGVFTWLRLFIFPVDLHFDRSELLFLTFQNLKVWLTVVVYSFALGVWFRNYSRLSLLINFLIIWFWIGLLPVSQVATSLGVQPGVISLAEHFLYLPSVAIFYFLVIAAQKIFTLYPKQKIFLKGIAGIFLMFFIFTTIEQNLYALNEEAMLKRSLEFQPFNSRIQFSLGMVYVNEGNFQKAEGQFRRALEVDPQHVRSRLALGKSLFDQGRFLESAAEYEKVKDPKQLKSLLERNKKETYQSLIKEYEGKILKNPEDVQLLFSLGVFYGQLGRVKEAMKYFEEVLKINPQHPDALFNLASGFESLGNSQQARLYFEKFLSLKNIRTDLKEYARKHLKEIPLPFGGGVRGGD